MVKSEHRLVRWLLLLLTLSLFFSGCTYLKNRGNDAMDIIDIGITFNNEWKPDFGLYFDFFNVLPIGYANVDGKMIGWGNRNAGWLDYNERSWGVIGWGSEKRGCGEFNPLDPHQARPDQRTLAERPDFNVGVVRMASEDNSPPVPQFFECNKMIFLGWIGIYNTCRPGDIIDFILGWTTLDIMGDDIAKAKE